LGRSQKKRLWRRTGELGKKREKEGPRGRGVILLQGHTFQSTGGGSSLILQLIGPQAKDVSPGTKKERVLCGELPKERERRKPGKGNTKWET